MNLENTLLSGRQTHENTHSLVVRLGGPATVASASTVTAAGCNGISDSSSGASNFGSSDTVASFAKKNIVRDRNLQGRIPAPAPAFLSLSNPVEDASNPPVREIFIKSLDLARMQTTDLRRQCSSDETWLTLKSVEEVS